MPLNVQPSGYRADAGARLIVAGVASWLAPMEL